MRKKEIRTKHFFEMVQILFLADLISISRALGLPLPLLHGFPPTQTPPTPSTLSRSAPICSSLPCLLLHYFKNQGMWYLFTIFFSY